MSSFRISARKLVRLAKKDQFSLELRLQWQKKFGYDPYNNLCQSVLMKNMVVATFALGFLGACGLFTLQYLRQYASSSQYAGWDVYVDLYTSFWMLVTSILVLRLAVVHMYKPGAHYKANAFCDNFSPLLKYLTFPNDTPLKTAKMIAPWDLAELRGRAKDVVIEAAEEVLEHEKVSRKSEVDSAWHSTKSKLDENFTKTYGSFELFNLVYGGYDYFFAEARKRIAERSDVAAA